MFERVLDISLQSYNTLITITRTSNYRCSIKKDYSKKFPNIHRETPVLESLFNKVKKRVWHRCFPVNIQNFLKTSILENIWQLLLNSRLITQAWKLPWIWSHFIAVHNYAFDYSALKPSCHFRKVFVIIH